ncbi:hypothetical protein JCM6882_005729 [Rhodosporidiobolus microsporus]
MQGQHYSQQQLHPSQYPPIPLPPTLRIGFIHPDLGLVPNGPLTAFGAPRTFSSAGGAERLVVDAAVELQKRGHDVEVFTSYHEDGEKGRSFEETRDGTLKVHVLGNSLFPRSFLGRFTIICAMLRQLHLTFSFLLASYFYHLASLPLLSSILFPLDHPFRSSSDWSLRRQLEPFDVLVVDQLSAAVPLLRWFGFNRVVFYCHFPDLLLSPSSAANPARAVDPRGPRQFSVGSEMRAFYRAPIDAVEQLSTGEADKILVNSEFTSQVFQRTFADLRRIPRVVYPAVDPDAYGKKVAVKDEDKWLVNEFSTLLSINRFEGKKDIALAVEAFAKVLPEHPNLRLVCAGGYDPRLADNVRTLAHLQQLAAKHNLSQHTYSASALPSVPSPVQARFRPTISPTPPSKDSTFPQIIFLLNASSSQKDLLLNAENSVALLYTPMFEHFGIVPLEGMASGLPVVATDSGGPTETVVDAGLPSPASSSSPSTATDDSTSTTTGLLRPRDPAAWSSALSSLLALSPSQRAAIGRVGQQRVRERFSRAKLGEDFELACKDAASIGYSIPYETGFKKALLAIFMASGAVLSLFAVNFLIPWLVQRSEAAKA